MFVPKTCVFETVDFDTFWLSLEESFNLRNKKPPFNKSVLIKLYELAKTNNSGSLTVCRHIESNTILAGTFTMSDKNKTYYICGYYNPTHKELGALSYLLWENITNCTTPIFDFEGSMIKEIEGEGMYRTDNFA